MLIINIRQNIRVNNYRNLLVFAAIQNPLLRR